MSSLSGLRISFVISPPPLLAARETQLLNGAPLLSEGTVQGSSGGCSGNPNFHALDSPAQASGYRSFFFNFNHCFKKIHWPFPILYFYGRQRSLLIFSVKSMLSLPHTLFKPIKRVKCRYLMLPPEDTLLKHLPFHEPFCSSPFRSAFSTSPDKIAQSKFQLKCLMVFMLSSNC